MECAGLAEAASFIAPRNYASWTLMIPSEIDLTTRLEGEKPNQTAVLSCWGQEKRIPRAYLDQTNGISISADPRTNEVYSLNLSMEEFDSPVFDRGLCWVIPAGERTELSFVINRDQPLNTDALHERMDGFMSNFGKTIVQLVQNQD